MIKSSARNQQSGFTLVELLVSMLLLGMLMMITYGTLYYSASAVERNVNSSINSEELVQIQSFMRKVISNASPDGTNFRGTARSLVLVANLTRDGQPDLYELEFHLRNKDFILDWERVDRSTAISADFSRPSSGSVVLVADIEDVHFFYSLTEFDEAPPWQTTWQGDEVLPKHIKIQIVGDQFWPELVLSTNVSHTIDCWYDPVSRGCRRR